MISNTDFEKLWFLYQTDGVQKDVSITSFYKQQASFITNFRRFIKNYIANHDYECGD